jgi:hypothetical protein
VVNALNDSGASTVNEAWSTTNNRFGLADFHNSALQAELLLRFPQLAGNARRRVERRSGWRV